MAATATGEHPARRAPGASPACWVCGDTDPAILEDARTACCNEDPVAYTCPDCGGDIYYLPDGTKPDYCPYC
ncbi:hypothetical protein ACIHFD_49805 [Nonomuraea sp. NPDC051941]|uniref:hypothetical protein n=1 Tax=Nonomuraea sp. NPDC051941 TaxID=3364373 RepID=UPI0037C61457